MDAAASTGDALADAPRMVIDAPVDRMIDAPCVVQVGPTCGGKLWSTDFSVDPRTIDNNCDGVADFHMHDGQQMPGTLSNGVWAEPGAMFAPAHLLETDPPDSFLTRTIVHARMRNVTAIEAGTRHGAFLAIDVGYNGTQFGTVFVEMRLTGDASSQNITLFEELQGNEILLVPGQGFDTGFHDVDLDIDPPSRKITFTVDGVDRGDRYFDLTTGTVDEAAALAADGANAEFDEFSVESCP
jgi:hypothetical protein